MNAHETASVDIFIIGAGPAGLTAALRLRQLGYCIQLIESSPHWPRTHIGEALTPGIKNIIELLNATEALADIPHLANIPTLLCWQSKTPEWVINSDSALVSRADFDAALMNYAQQQGVNVAQPASIKTIAGAAYDWTITFVCDGIVHTTKAQFIIDASGRNGHRQFACAERLSAIWTEIPHAAVPANIHNTTRVEALEDGWLWGSSLPDNRYRVMWVGDPQSQRKSFPKQPEKWLGIQCSSSQLFQPIANTTATQPIKVCAATPSLSLDSWQEGYIKIGDAAFSLDPISSSGVEKAMRFSLTAAVTIHTILTGDNASCKATAQDFFKQRLIETCARHSYWSQSCYAKAWCKDKIFWQLRSGIAKSPMEDGNSEDEKNLIGAFHQQLNHLDNYNPPPLKPLTHFDMTRLLSFDVNTRFIDTHCVIDNQVKNQLALHHPAVERPLAYLEGESLLPNLNMLKQPQTLSALLGNLSHCMPLEKAQKITAWLWQRGIIASI